MNAILKISGVPAKGLSGLHNFLASENLTVEERPSLQAIELKDVRLEDGKTTYLVTLELQLIDETSTPKIRMRHDKVMKLIRSLDSRLLPMSDMYGDAERNMEEFKAVLGHKTPFEVTNRKTGLIILQKGQAITQGRLEELVAIPIGDIDWTERADMNDKEAFFNKLLWWMYEGGVYNCEFSRYTRV